MSRIFVTLDVSNLFKLILVSPSHPLNNSDESAGRKTISDDSDTLIALIASRSISNFSSQSRHKVPPSE